MQNKLSDEYKNELYIKVLEKKAARTKKRKKMVSAFAVFILFIGMGTYGYTKFNSDGYENYFVSSTENKMIDDEYQYFDDLGIKLEFINVDENQVSIGINLQYEDIADYYIYLNNFTINNIGNSECNIKYIYDRKFISKNEIVYIISYNNINKNKEYLIELEGITLRRTNTDDIFNIEISYNKKISIED